MNGASETVSTVGTADPVTTNGNKGFSFGLGELGGTDNVGFGILSLNLTLHF